ncbi:hypothetical protein [Azospirillum sp. SYSU D00513]|uniref:hypothetical protein n=1 Tax=Azospirillum sp. SYSU D00513 TaxID=2812561 RepID=UPI001A9738EA|nr:hypothetical protein [Azospirillum sp. SYSU D00513]
MRSTDKIIRLAETGVNLTVDASGRSAESLFRIAQASRQAGGYLTVINTEKIDTEDLVKLARFGLGAITIAV